MGVLLISFHCDPTTGVPAFRQLIDQVLALRAQGRLREGDRLPPVRRLAAHLSLNPNTVQRAYRELEVRGVLAARPGIGTFLTAEEAGDEEDRIRCLRRLAADCAARAGREGFLVRELIDALKEGLD